MADDQLTDQLVKYLSDAHSIEEQALQQMKSAPGIAGDPQIASLFERHLEETEGHERLIRDRMAAYDADPSKLKDVVAAAGGAGMILFARAQPDTPGKLVAHAFSYEHLEEAAYELLRRVAERAGDAETAAVAAQIGDQERAMGDRLEGVFERAAIASMEQGRGDEPSARLVKYLADAHALEAQAEELLQRAVKIGGDPELIAGYRDHLVETQEHKRLLAARLDALDASPSALKDAALRLGALQWGMFFQAQPDTPGKLAAFAFAFEHLEIGGYEQLRVVARQAADTETAALAERILSDERRAAERIFGAFDRAVDAMLTSQAIRSS
jgi:ferritin-like metal-binding protein YciE